MTRRQPPLTERRAGILLHPTSLPAGDLSHDAYRFVEFLANAGMSVWQTLPLGPTHDDGSPYQCLSAHAGNPRLISLDWLVDRGWLARSARHLPRADQLRAAWRGFTEHAGAEERELLAGFSAAQSDWLDDYALYTALRQAHGNRPWVDWPAPVRDRKTAALLAARDDLREAAEQVQFEQFVFFTQWQELKTYAARHGVLLFGDLPIFVAHDSADAWAHRKYFAIDAQGNAEAVAGVPPDYFSETGQRWGNPQYRWERMRADGFRWWVRRLRTQLTLFDLVRIDHFRGFESYWSIPAASATAVNGHWVKGPGDALFRALERAFDPLPLVAEDLGIITPEVDALRRRHGLPGMKVLQFAFDGSADNAYLPHHHQPDYVVYTGTHDNDTTMAWFTGLDTATQDYVLDYLGRCGEPMPWPLIRAALASVSQLAMVPLQDVLGLGTGHHMNRPGTSTGNWRWRFEWDWIPADLASRLQHLNRLYGRIRTT